MGTRNNPGELLRRAAVAVAAVAPWATYWLSRISGTRKNLRVDADDFAALVAVVGEDVLVALDAVWVVVPQDIPGQDWYIIIKQVSRQDKI